MTASPKTLAIPFENQKTVKLMQVPGKVLSNARMIGMHWKIVAIMLAIA
jgi:hypothetical protein